MIRSSILWQLYSNTGNANHMEEYDKAGRLCCKLQCFLKLELCSTKVFYVCLMQTRGCLGSARGKVVSKRPTLKTKFDSSLDWQTWVLFSVNAGGVRVYLCQVLDPVHFFPLRPGEAGERQDGGGHGRHSKCVVLCLLPPTDPLPFFSHLQHLSLLLPLLSPSVFRPDLQCFIFFINLFPLCEECELVVVQNCDAEEAVHNRWLSILAPERNTDSLFRTQKCYG